MSDNDQDRAANAPSWQFPQERQPESDAYHIWTPRPLLRSIYWKPEASLPHDLVSSSYEVFVDQRAWLAMHAHVWQAPLTTVPFGYLVGDLCEDPNVNRRFVIVTGAIPSRFDFNENASDQITREAGLALRLEIDRLRGILVGWYHRHIEGAVQLSEQDLATHRKRFADPWQCAFLFVGDGARSKGGCFRSTSTEMSPDLAFPFYEMASNNSLLPRGLKRSYLDWDNYTTVDEIRSEPPTRPELVVPLPQAPPDAPPDAPPEEELDKPEFEAGPEASFEVAEQPEAEVEQEPEVVVAEEPETEPEEELEEEPEIVIAGESELESELEEELEEEPEIVIAGESELESELESEPEVAEQLAAVDEVAELEVEERDVAELEVEELEQEPEVVVAEEPETESETELEEEPEIVIAGESELESEPEEELEQEPEVAEQLAAVDEVAELDVEELEQEPELESETELEEEPEIDVAGESELESEPEVEVDQEPEEAPEADAEAEEELVVGLDLDAMLKDVEEIQTGSAAGDALDAVSDPGSADFELVDVQADGVADEHGGLSSEFSLHSVSLPPDESGPEEDTAPEPVRESPGEDSESMTAARVLEAAALEVESGPPTRTPSRRLGRFVVGLDGEMQGRRRMVTLAVGGFVVAAAVIMGLLSITPDGTAGPDRLSGDGAQAVEAPASVGPGNSNGNASVTREQLEEQSQEMLAAISRYYGQIVAMDDGTATCEGLRAAFVTVENGWIEYNARYKARYPGRLPPDLAARDERLYLGVQDVEREFERSGCPRP